MLDLFEIKKNIDCPEIGYYIIHGQSLTSDELIKELAFSLGDLILGNGNIIQEDSFDYNHIDDVKSRKKKITKKNGLLLSSASNDTILLHTDCSYLKKYVDYMILFCIEPAENGGESTILSINKLISELSKKTVHTLCNSDFPFRFGFSPVLHLNKNIYHIRFHYGEIITSAKQINFEFSTDQLDALNELRDKLLSSKYILRRKLLKNECLILNNKYTLHGRTSFKGNKRLLRRVRIISKR